MTTWANYERCYFLEVRPRPDDIPKIPIELLYPDDVIEDEVEDNAPRDGGRCDW